MTTKTTKQNKNAGINHDTRASENVANKTMAPMRHLGVGIDTARYGHHVTFLREDKQPAARPSGWRANQRRHREL